MEPLKLHWSSSKKNFGDWLSPAICQKCSGRPIQHAPPERCDLVAIGSILGRVKHGWFARRIHVWGAGFIEAQRPVPARHHYHAVRGHLTAELIRGISITAFGDPGLLCDLLVPDYRTIPKKHRLGIVAHYKDRGHGGLSAYTNAHPETILLDVFTEPVALLREICSCEFILSSSLHGLIAADAFGIPNAWVKLSEHVRGADFKYRDYYSIFGFNNIKPIDSAPVLTCSQLKQLACEYLRPDLEGIKQRLIASFPFPEPARQTI